MAAILVQASQMNPDGINHLWFHLKYNLVSVIICSAFLMFGTTVYIMTRHRSVFLVDYSCYLPPNHLQAKFQQFMEHSKLTRDFDDSLLEFQRTILESFGLGEETYVPEMMHYLPPRPSMAAAREESEQVTFGFLDYLFANMNVKPKDIGILAKGRMQKGINVWQIVFGSGFKCNSTVWQALLDTKPSPNSPSQDCISKYPVELMM